MIHDAPDVLTIKDTMMVLRCGRTKILQLIHDGVLDAHFVCGKWLVFKTDVEEFIARS